MLESFGRCFCHLFFHQRKEHLLNLFSRHPFWKVICVIRQTKQLQSQHTHCILNILLIMFTLAGKVNQLYAQIVECQEHKPSSPSRYISHDRCNILWRLPSLTHTFRISIKQRDDKCIDRFISIQMTLQSVSDHASNWKRKGQAHIPPFRSCHAHFPVNQDKITIWSKCFQLINRGLCLHDDIEDVRIAVDQAIASIVVGKIGFYSFQHQL
mmetsp:Transcript_5533/g.9352  ORF Transcript_5533/g.9352 Transcript_5533/m.9352 type:complete len:211 (+) Transcript_5533:246-878(+)